MDRWVALYGDEGQALTKAPDGHERPRVPDHSPLHRRAAQVLSWLRLWASALDASRIIISACPVTAFVVTVPPSSATTDSVHRRIPPLPCVDEPYRKTVVFKHLSLSSTSRLTLYLPLHFTAMFISPSPSAPPHFWSLGPVVLVMPSHDPISRFLILFHGYSTRVLFIDPHVTTPVPHLCSGRARLPVDM